jgi:hypothetical protein
MNYLLTAIFQCEANHGCSHTCGRVNGVDTCSCPTGMVLDNTNKTCVGGYYHVSYESLYCRDNN